MKLDTIVIVLAVTAATFQTGYLLADTSRADIPGMQQPMTDLAITSQIRNAYQLEPVLNSSVVIVKTIHGTVNLAGVVESDEEASQAENIASRIGGVREVRSHLRVINRVASSAL